MDNDELVEKVACEIADLANRCCYRNDGYEENIRDSAKQLILPLLAQLQAELDAVMGENHRLRHLLASAPRDTQWSGHFMLEVDEALALPAQVNAEEARTVSADSWAWLQTRGKAGFVIQSAGDMWIERAEPSVADDGSMNRIAISYGFREDGTEITSLDEYRDMIDRVRNDLAKRFPGSKIAFAGFTDPKPQSPEAEQRRREVEARIREEVEAENVHASKSVL